MSSSTIRRVLVVAALVAGVLAPATADAATVTLHVAGKSKLSLGTNTYGVRFFLGVYGSTPDLYGVVTEQGQPVTSAFVDIEARDLKHFGSTSWKTVCESVTDADGGYTVSAADCTSRGLGSWYPLRSIGLRAVLKSNYVATSVPIGWFVIPDIQIVASTRSSNTYGPARYTISGRLRAASDATGRLVLRKIGEPAELAESSVQGGKRFALSLSVSSSGLERLRLEFVPASSTDTEAAERDIALRVAVRAPPVSAPTRRRSTTVTATPAPHPHVKHHTKLPDVQL